MQPVHVNIRPIGNSLGFVVPRPLLAQAGLEHEAELTIEHGALVLRAPAKTPRAGWAQAAQAIAATGDDDLVLGDFGNTGDAELAW